MVVPVAIIMLIIMNHIKQTSKYSASKYMKTAVLWVCENMQ